MNPENLCLALYLFFFALPFFGSYFSVWFTWNLNAAFQARHAHAPRWLRWFFCGLMCFMAAFCSFSTFSSFQTAALYLNMHLLLQAGRTEEASILLRLL